VAPALETESAKAGESLAPYVGSYDSFPWGGEALVFAWGDDLGAVEVPTFEPVKEMDRLRKTGEHRFRRVRDDGSLGETVTFEIGPDGKATKLWWHSNPYPRMK
jgi:hypothetical protein